MDNQEGNNICPKYSVSGVTVSIRIDSLQAERMGQFLPAEDLFFDINAKLEEVKKTGEEVILGFNLIITTKPNVVKYLSAGTVTLSGKAADIKKKLEINPKTKIPQILFTVYQHAFNSIYMLSAILNTPYPPPDLLHPMAEKIQIISSPSEKVQAENQPEMQVVPPDTVAAATATAQSAAK